jgi:hypothetical protein
MGMRCKNRNGKSPSNEAKRSEGRRDGRGGGQIDQLLKIGKGRKGHTRKKDNKIKK